MPSAPSPEDLGPYIRSWEHYTLLRHILSLNPTGTALEFGVASGTSARYIAEHMPVIGFDSFQGLPLDWRPGFPKGSFKGDPPDVPNCELVIGLFEDTLPRFDFDNVGEIGLVHLDADLYESTATALKYIGPHLKPGCYVCFDEAHGYPGADQHEWRAWREFAEISGIRWSVIGHSVEQWGIQIA